MIGEMAVLACIFIGLFARLNAPIVTLTATLVAKLINTHGATHI